VTVLAVLGAMRLRRGVNNHGKRETVRYWLPTNV
jgi:hypothetical protein